jgi:hypothetical protein
MRKREMTMKTIFKMKGPSKAVLSDEDQLRLVSIPASAMVVLVEGNVHEDPTVKIRFGGKVLRMLSSEFRHCAELWGQSA